MNPTIFAKLRNVLAKLFPDESSIRRMVDDAGLDRQKIDFSSSVINIWHSILAEAEKVDRVEALLRAVTNDGYGDNREFQAASAAYRQLRGKDEGINLASNIPTKQPKAHAQTWQPRLPVLLFAILLIGITGGGSYWMLWGSQPGVNVTPTATATVSNTAVIQEQLAEGTLTPAELPTSTPTATLPSPTSMVIVTATITESSAIASVSQATTALPQPTATAPPTLTPTTASAGLCSFAFLVLDDQSEEPIRRATIAVFVGIRQETGTTDSTGYYLAKLPCSNGQEVEARVRVSANDYAAYNRSVFLSNETTEILLERKATPTSTQTPTTIIAPIPTPIPQSTATVTPTAAPTYPCEAEVVSPRGVVPVSIAFRQRPNEGNRGSRSYQPGDKVIIKKTDESGGWYLIAELSNLERGWAAAEYFTNCSKRVE